MYYPSSNKEWFSSTYSYNKSYSKLLIVYDLITNKLFATYFNMLIDKIKILYKRRRDNKSRYSANKIYVSRAEFKHSNTKLLIIISMYNKQKSILLRKTRKVIYIKRMYKLLVELKDKYVVKFKDVLTKLKSLVDKSRMFKNWNEVKGKSVLEWYIPSQVNRLNHTWNHVFKRKLLLFNKWNMIFLKKNKNIFNSLILNFNYKNLYKIPLYRNLQSNYTVVDILFNNTRLISFNTSKYNNLVLTLRNLGLISLLEKVYGKRVEIKLIDLKSLHLNSDVFASSVALKLRDRKNNPVRILRKAILQIVRVPDLHTLITFDDNSETINKNNIISTIKQQVVSGVRFEASGRLTRRLTAMRAVFKYRYVGSLKNLRSSLNNKSATLLRGYAKANSQYTLINSKTRNGTFGLKGWVSSH